MKKMDWQYLAEVNRNPKYVSSEKISPAMMTFKDFGDEKTTTENLQGKFFIWQTDR